MDAEWIKSPTARRIVLHWADRRPAWLWSHDGSTLLWRNAAARLFNAKIKKNGLKLSAGPVPIKGQVARLIRLGSVGRSSLSRVQFLAGDRPVATTCSCTPLTMPDGTAALLLAGVDPIEADVLDAAGEFRDESADNRVLLPEGAEYLLVENGKVLRGSAQALLAHTGEVETAGLPEESGTVTRLKANSGDAVLLVYAAEDTAPSRISEVRAEEGVSSDEAPAHADDLHADDLAHTPEPMLPLGLEMIAEPPAPQAVSDDWVDPLPPPSPDRALSSLFDRLVEDATLYTALTADDEVFDGPPAIAEPAEEILHPVEALGPEPLIAEAPLVVDPPPEPIYAPPDLEEPPALPQDMIEAVIEYADDPEIAEPPDEQPRTHWMITGRGFRVRDPAPGNNADFEPEAPSPIEPPTDPETAERVSRYNFEELGRILTDRVSGDGTPRVEPEPPIAPRPVAPEGVVNLNAETLVLNRLPLAIMVFRDQQVLFANRALTDLLGYESVESLRGAGLGSIFPGDESSGAGPINRLVRRDGTQLQVTARLQSVSWQGRAALMLSASPGEPIRGHEGAVRAFAEIAAEAREEGFLIADRAGMITQLSGHGSVLLGQPAQDILGKPLAILVSKSDMDPLRQFLEKPARFAETARPSLLASSDDGETEIVLFAEGQAGIVTGYFGFLKSRLRVTQVATPDTDAEIEPGMLGRLSRGIRRPLNTIIGFADLIRSAAFGSLDTERYAEYARDIRTAGLEIAVLVDELDDFTRLRDGRYAPRPADVDLSALLESCVVRVKSQAGAARVLVRSAISEQLPRIHADRASLGQALLNLLASAIDQTPIGGSVILSAQSGEDGSVAIHVRDGAENAVDLGERFVVFRDGVDKDGEQLGPVRSSVGLALTRSLLAVNACSLSVDPTIGTGTLFSLLIPADLVVKGQSNA